jgi:hypothetical protein
MKKTKRLKDLVRKIYLKRKKEDSMVGQSINELVQSLHYMRSPKSRAEEQNKENIAHCIKELGNLKKETRLKDEFPTFPVFYAYILNPENKLTLEDIKSLL